MSISFKEKVKGYIDLTRAHFAPIWPLLFCSGLMLAFRNYGDFSWSLLIRVAFIGFFGFQAGMVLNDILDRDIDHIENDKTMTNYWRPFKERPIPFGRVSLVEAIIICVIFLVIAIGLIATLPFPNYLYVYAIMIYAYLVETFYNLKKRNQKVPIAQIIGRTDLTVFPLAGYLSHGQIDIYVLLFAVFMYPWALAHLATNDIIDFENDQAKNLKTITVLYGIQGNVIWINILTLSHLIILPIFLLFGQFSYIALGGFILASIILITANILIIKNKNAKSNLITLPMFHSSLFLYTITIILDTTLLQNHALLTI